MFKSKIHLPSLQPCQSPLSVGDEGSAKYSTSIQHLFIKAPSFMMMMYAAISHDYYNVDEPPERSNSSLTLS